MCRAFTLIPFGIGVCSFAMMINPKGLDIGVFAGTETGTEIVPTIRPVKVLDPEILEQVAMDSAITNSAVIVASANPVKNKLEIEASLCAFGTGFCSPMVTAINPFALPPGSGIVTTVAENVPPLEGNGPVSTKNTGPAGGWVTEASNALPVKVVVEVEVDVVVFQAETRGMEE